MSNIRKGSPETATGASQGDQRHDLGPALEEAPTAATVVTYKRLSGLMKGILT